MRSFLSLCLSNFPSTGVLKFKMVFTKVKLNESMAKWSTFQWFSTSSTSKHWWLFVFVISFSTLTKLGTSFEMAKKCSNDRPKMSRFCRSSGVNVSSLLVWPGPRSWLAGKVSPFFSVVWLEEVNLKHGSGFSLPLRSKRAKMAAEERFSVEGRKRCVSAGNSCDRGTDRVEWQF